MLAFNILYWLRGRKQKHEYLGSLKIHKQSQCQDNTFENNFTVLKRHDWFRLVSV